MVQLNLVEFIVIHDFILLRAIVGMIFAVIALHHIMQSAVHS